METQDSSTRSVWHIIARSGAAALTIEVISPKISGVTATENFKGLTSIAFIQSSYYIYDTLLELPTYRSCVPLGTALLKLVRSILEDPLIKTNTCLGYGMTIISVASSLLYSLRAGNYTDPELGILEGYGKLEKCLKEESPEHLLESIALTNPSYHGRYSTTRRFENVYDLLVESAPWDLVARNIVSKFSATLELYRCVKSRLIGEVIDAVSKCYRLGASEFIDSISFKSGGAMLSRFIQLLASSSMNSEEARRILVNEIGINLGSISDIVASAVALVLIEEGARMWYDTGGI